MIRVRLNPAVLDMLEHEATQRGIPLSGLVRAILEGYISRKTGCRSPYFSLSGRALERVAHVKFLQAIGRLRFIIAGSGLDVPALREKRLLEVCDIIDKLNAAAQKIKDPQKRLWFYDRIARFYRIFDMMANNVEYDTIKRTLDEMEAEEIASVGRTPEESDKGQGKQS